MGYDIPRFIEQPPPSDLLCGLCQNICEDIVACQEGHQFCRICIENWLEANLVCPRDGSTLRLNMLINPGRTVSRRLSSLELKCQFHTKGCVVVSTVEDEADHYANCHFNEELHTRASLIKDIGKLRDQMEIFKGVLEHIHKENMDLKTEVHMLRVRMQAAEERLKHTPNSVDHSRFAEPIVSHQSNRHLFSPSYPRSAGDHHERNEVDYVTQSSVSELDSDDDTFDLLSQEESSAFPPLGAVEVTKAPSNPSLAGYSQTLSNGSPHTKPKLESRDSVKSKLRSAFKPFRPLTSNDFGCVASEISPPVHATPFNYYQPPDHSLSKFFTGFPITKLKPRNIESLETKAPVIQLKLFSKDDIGCEPTIGEEQWRLVLGLDKSSAAYELLQFIDITKFDIANAITRSNINNTSYQLNTLYGVLKKGHKVRFTFGSQLLVLAAAIMVGPEGVIYYNGSNKEHTRKYIVNAGFGHMLEKSRIVVSYNDPDYAPYDVIFVREKLNSIHYHDMLTPGGSVYDYHVSKKLPKPTIAVEVELDKTSTKSIKSVAVHTPRKPLVSYRRDDDEPIVSIDSHHENTPNIPIDDLKPRPVLEEECFYENTLNIPLECLEDHRPVFEEELVKINPIIASGVITQVTSYDDKSSEMPSHISPPITVSGDIDLSKQERLLPKNSLEEFEITFSPPSITNDVNDSTANEVIHVKKTLKPPSKKVRSKSKKSENISHHTQPFIANQTVDHVKSSKVKTEPITVAKPKAPKPLPTTVFQFENYGRSKFKINPKQVKIVQSIKSELSKAASEILSNVDVLSFSKYAKSLSSS